MNYIPQSTLIPKINLIPNINLNYEIVTNHKNDIENNFLPESIVSNDTLINTIKFLKRLSTNSGNIELKSIIDLTCEYKLYEVNFIFEWISFFHNFDMLLKELDACSKRRDFKQELNSYIKNIYNDKTVPGIVDLVGAFIENEGFEDYKRKYGIYNHYTSEIRQVITNFLLKLRQSCDFDGKYDSSSIQSIIEYLSINVFLFNIDEIKNICNIIKTHQDADSDIRTLSIILPKIISISIKEENPYIELIKLSIINIKNPILRFIYVFLLSEEVSTDETLLFLEESSISIIIKLVYLLNLVKKEKILEELGFLNSSTIKNGCVKGLIINGCSSFSNKLIFSSSLLISKINQTKTSTLDQSSDRIIQKYLDNTDNLIMSYILSRFFCNPDSQFSYKLNLEFNDLLNKLELFDLKIILNSSIRQMISRNCNDTTKITNKPHMNNQEVNNEASVEFEMMCIFCNSKVQKNERIQQQTFINNPNNQFSHEGKEIISYCNNSKCNRPLPSCCICLQSIEVQNEVVSLKPNQVKNEIHENDFGKNESSQPAKLIWCLKCRHGGHYEHLIDWFMDLTICSNSTCDCICLENSLMII